MARLNIFHISLIALSLYGCGTFFEDSYEEDVANDREVLNAMIKANPVLDSVPDNHRFFETGAEYGRLTGWLNLSGVGLNDSNFSFPKDVKNFKIIVNVSLSGNEFTDLPRGTRLRNWAAILVIGNKICDPSSETVTYLDQRTKGSLGGYWRDSQHCDDSIPTVDP